MSFIKTSARRRTGFSLVEVVLALGVVSAAVLALIGILGSTFTSAREIALQHAAVNAVSQLDGAFRSATGISNIPAASVNDSPFTRIYTLLAKKSALNGTNYVDFFVYQKYSETSNGLPTPAVPVVFLPDSGKFTKQDSLNQQHENIDTSTVFRMRVRLSRLLENKLYKLDKTTYEADPSARWNYGQSLDASPDNYALAYLPLTVEIFTHDFTEATNPGDNPDPLKELVRPVITTTVVLNR